MADYEAEITAVFPTPHLAGKFAREYEHEMGYAPDRDGSTVTCLVHRHGDEFVFTERAADLGGTVNVKVLADRE